LDLNPSHSLNRRETTGGKKVLHDHVQVLRIREKVRKSRGNRVKEVLHSAEGKKKLAKPHGKGALGKAASGNSGS